MPTGITSGSLLNRTNPTTPGLPTYNTGSLAGQDQQNIGNLLSGNFDPYEYNMASAENALGTGGGGFAAGQRYKLLDSEKLKRQAMGHEFLNPYLEREQQTALQSSAERARMNEIAAQGAQALQQLQLEEAGRSARSSEEIRARLEQQILEGNQAMERLRVTETGETARQRTGIGGNLANTLLSNYGRGGPNGSTTRGVGGSFSGPDSNNGLAGGLSGTGYMQPGFPNDNAPTNGGGGFMNSAVQRILNQYGIRL